MLENLLQLVKENAGDAIINNPAIPNQDNDAACESVASSIFDGLKNYASDGGIGGLMNMFQGGTGGDHSLISSVSGNAISNLMSKFNLSEGAASGIVQSLVPTVINNLVHKTNDPNDDSFNLESIASALMGGGGGLLDKLKGFF